MDAIFVPCVNQNLSILRNLYMIYELLFPKRTAPDESVRKIHVVVDWRDIFRTPHICRNRDEVRRFNSNARAPFLFFIACRNRTLVSLGQASQDNPMARYCRDCLVFFLRYRSFAAILRRGRNVNPFRFPLTARFRLPQRVPPCAPDYPPRATHVCPARGSTPARRPLSPRPQIPCRRTRTVFPRLPRFARSAEC